jgi:hypothetical protein
VRSAFLAAIVLIFTLPLSANQLHVEPSVVRLGEAVEISVRLEGSFAGVSSLRLPIANLTIEHGPSTSTEFSVMNGVMSRSKTFQYLARPRREGSATVGPIELAHDGRRLRLEAVTITVLPEVMPPSSEPSVPPEQRRGRGGMFVTVQADRAESYLGEQVNLTWTLYSRAPLRGFRLTAVPVMENFWTEEIPLPRQDTETVVLEGEVLNKVVVRRVAVFPLRTGTFRIAPLEVLAEAMVPDDFFGGWGFFERRVEDHRLRSAMLEIAVNPLPEAAAAVGHFGMHCSAARIPQQGPVTFDVTLSGTGNLRAVHPPRFEGAVDATVEIQQRELTVSRHTQPIRMTRSWRVLLFPREAGPLRIPSMRFDYFHPESGRVQSLQCREQAVAVRPSNTSTAPPLRARSEEGVARSERGAALLPSLLAPRAVGVMLSALILTGAVWAGVKHRRADSPLLEELMGFAREPREFRRVLYDRVNGSGLRIPELFRDETPLGESFRALHSLVDLMEKEPWEVEPSRSELRFRTREFLRQLKRYPSSVG